MRLTHLQPSHVDLAGHRLITSLAAHEDELENWWNSFTAKIRGRLHRVWFTYDREAATHGDKLGLSFAQTFALNACAPGRFVLQLGNPKSKFSSELKRKLCRVTSSASPANPAKNKTKLHGLMPAPRLPQNVPWFDEILVLDLIEQLPDPEKFMGGLRKRMARGGSEVIITVSNGAFAMKRVLRALSAREAKRPAASEANHRRVFTFKSLQTLLAHAGYEIVEARGVPAPFTQEYGRKRWTRALLRLNECLLKLSRQWFAYEICVRARPVA
jgi:hypothetical protein